MSQNQTIQLLQISDTHCYSHTDAYLEWSSLPVQPNRNLRLLLKHLQHQYATADALIISGDLAQEVVAGTYERIAELLKDFSLPVYALAGNHDVPALMQVHLNSLVSKTIRPFSATQFAQWHCLFLDSSAAERNDGFLQAEQLDQLEHYLAGLHTDSYALIFLHHHPVPIGSPWIDPWGLQNNTTFWDTVAAFPSVKAVCFGHIHNEFASTYSRKNGHSIAVYGTPATCVQLDHTSDQPRFIHTHPAWREIILHPDGQLKTAVHYLTESNTALA